jgi:hypothetical protein
VVYEVLRQPQMGALESTEAERTATKRGEEKRMKRTRRPADRNPERAPEHRHGERRDPPPASARASRQPSTARPGVPIFANTAEGQAERLAYYEARKLDQPPDSLLDYYDVRRGRETPAERRAREARASGRRQGRLHRERSPGAGAGSGCRTRAE